MVDAKMKRSMSLSDELRAAIDHSTMSRYEICKRLSFSESVMSRFMGGKCGLALDTVDRIAELLDLHITTGKRRRKVNS